ncbi:MAG: hypothetical protein ACKO1F_06940 [Flammeovirgaceae bacterium]
MPSSLLNKVFPFTHWYFGTKTKEEKILLKQIIHDTSPLFLKWAINEILHWKNVERPDNVLLINGTRDRIFPIDKLNVDFKIENGGHFMVYSEAKKISNILEKIRPAK